MKFTAEHYKSLKQHIANIGLNLKQEQAWSKARRESDVKFLWDIFWKSKWSVSHKNYHSLYEEPHLLTAINKAVKELIHEQEVHEEGNLA